MKIKVLAIILLSAVTCLAKTNNQNSSSANETQTKENGSVPKAECPCCQSMAESQDAKPCCHHDSAASDSKKMVCDGKDAKSCMGGQDAMSCMKDDKAKSAEACCGKGDQKGCCAKSDKTSEQTAMTCCGGSHNHCGMQAHDHADPGK